MIIVTVFIVMASTFSLTVAAIRMLLTNKKKHLYWFVMSVLVFIYFVNILAGLSDHGFAGW